MKYLLLITLSFLLISIQTHTEENLSAQNPEINEIYIQVKKLLLKYFPEATSNLIKNKIQFEFNTRKFLIHVPLKTGEWQDVAEEKGPNANGILGSIEIIKGTYIGQAILPQSFDSYYFTKYVCAPYSKKIDSYLKVELAEPKNGINKEFSKDFYQILTSFGQESKPTDHPIVEKQSSVYAFNSVTNYNWYRDLSLEKDLNQGKELKSFPSAGSMITIFNGISSKALVIENNKISVNATNRLKLEFNEDESKELRKGKLVQKGNLKYGLFFDFEAKRDILNIHEYNQDGKLINLYVFFKLTNQNEK